MPQEKLSKEIEAFQGMWTGGYYEGDASDYLTRSAYGSFGYISILHAIYLRCIKPYVNAETVALEIGPGHGAWTKTLLEAKEVWALDALSAEYNQFFEYLNHPKNVRYFQVSDFECRELPENHFDYMFSFGCLCHVSFDGISSYAENIFDKLKPGANCFWMIADKRKYAQFIKDAEKFDVWNALAPKKGKSALRKLFQVFSKATRPPFLTLDVFSEDIQGHWQDADIDRTCQMLEKIGYKIIEKDIGIIARDPMIHFMKP